MEYLLQFIKKLLPKALVSRVRGPYHRTLALLGALIYRFPGRSLVVIGVTGTKGKTTVTELLYRALTEAGEKVALSNTIHFIVGEEEERNLYKMTTPGRFFMQRFLRGAVNAGCRYAVLELSSEGAALYRHKHIPLDALVFTNLTPEHIESHGSFEAYKGAKLRLRDALERSSKKEKYVVVNKDDPHHGDFAEVKSAAVHTFSMKDANPYTTNERGSLFTYKGVSVHSPLLGEFNISNMLAVLSTTEALGIPFAAVKKSLESAAPILGRVEKVERGQSFEVYVDYAHTPESLEALYRAFGERKKICVLGNCGGGRDAWKRPKMGEVADRYCDEIILTNEDPYDEDPEAILNDMKAGITVHTAQVVLERRAAIQKALETAKEKEVVLITGKGTDPYIMGANGARTPWSDATVAAEILDQLK